MFGDGDGGGFGTDAGFGMIHIDVGESITHCHMAGYIDLTGYVTTSQTLTGYTILNTSLTGGVNVTTYLVGYVRSPTNC